ncbi:hypothetical protein PT077_08980, partial [Erysipelothrix rhusiopathiae]|nr:hypothetical protein [Erysipelothrix rhusiopathiae]
RNMGTDAIFIIVDDGLAQDVMHVAKNHGATGGTIIHARGSGTPYISSPLLRIIPLFLVVYTM